MWLYGSKFSRKLLQQSSKGYKQLAREERDAKKHKETVRKERGAVRIKCRVPAIEYDGLLRHVSVRDEKEEHRKSIFSGKIINFPLKGSNFFSAKRLTLLILEESSVS